MNILVENDFESNDIKRSQVKKIQKVGAEYIFLSNTWVTFEIQKMLMLLFWDEPNKK